ncbi:hypothetical protein BK653_03580 [Pseudomonas brassicacearum]|uniref:hypothetical protein n=1 Tax=Pseudomonas brassicacearum TaxID=930166 RepID=UPI000F4A2F97|nr:hypothetical protein [Pseudomonas brassicacearum]ROM70978.1 hypothetical protein BK653_03580 [Pseudomonas brassicacearum]
MKRNLSLVLVILAATLGGCAANKPANDPSLIDSWKGLRVENGKCQFLSCAAFAVEDNNRAEPFTAKEPDWN